VNGFDLLGLCEPSLEYFSFHRAMPWESYREYALSKEVNPLVYQGLTMITFDASWKCEECSRGTGRGKYCEGKALHITKK
jgi:hypothetical protein